MLSIDGDRRAEICQRAAMNAIRESVRHDIDKAFRAEERARRYEGGDEGTDDADKDETDPVPAITKEHFEVLSKSCQKKRN